MSAKKTSPRKKNDIKTTLIIILTLIVGVESYLLWRKSDHTKPAVKTQKIKEPTIKVTKVNTLHKSAVVPVTGPLTAIKKAAPGSAGKIAIVLDDWGYATHNCKYLQSIHAPLAVAILPNLRHSDDIAKCAAEAGKDSILHLPMEPYHNGDKYPDNYLITTTMKADTVLSLLEDTLKKMPYIQGVNNHMGSKAMEDSRLITLIFKHLKRRGLFFVDSMTSPNRSVGRQIAAQVHLPFAQRDVFLDNINTKEAIEKQIRQLADRARKKGYAIAIGHDRELTLQTLQEAIPVLQAQGFEIVRIKDLVKSQ